MGFLDALLGRSKPAAANLDRLFALPGAAITLEAAEGLKPALKAGVCFKPVAGQSFAATEEEFKQLLSSGDKTKAQGAATLVESNDEYGYRWAVVAAEDFNELVTNVHYVNSTLQDHGYGPQLLCSVFPFSTATTVSLTARGVIYLVYLYKRGSFYPFVPDGDERRDNEAELRIRAEIGQDLLIEKDLEQWFPIWKLPFN